MSTPTPSAGPRYAFYALSVVLVLLALGAFGTSSSGEVTMLGVTMEAKYACALYFVMGVVAMWAAMKAGRIRVKK